MLLFVNACMREGSRTERLARAWLSGREEDVVEVRLGQTDVRPLDAETIKTYNASVSAADYSDEMFAFAKQFAQADEVVIAAPLWNYSIPAKLHDYLELVCSQGVTFDLDAESGTYVSLCRAQKLTVVTTAGGPRPAVADDHAFGYVATLAREFWHIPEIIYVAAWSLDGPDADIDALLSDALAHPELTCDSQEGE